MIRRIRKTHKIVWLILAALLPLLFAASLVFRHREPVNEKIPGLAAETQRAPSFQK